MIANHLEKKLKILVLITQNQLEILMRAFKKIKTKKMNLLKK